MNLKPGDYVRTPRFCTVRIKETFETEREARHAGYTEPTYYEGADGVLGKSVSENHLEFASFPL